MNHKIFSTPEDAESAFYEAFETADADAMMAVWAEDEDIVCVHPTGPRLQGHAAVHQSWRQLFRNGAAIRFQISDSHRFRDALLSVHVVHENIYVDGEPQPQPPVIATNIYQLTDKGWRMILHHASLSPDAPARSHEGIPQVLH